MQVCVTRFNNKTLNENKQWKINNNFNGCIYGTPVKITDNIMIDESIIIIEMNNSENKIEGFGIIKNKLFLRDKKYRIYSDNNYNRYIYKSNFYLSVHEITDKYLKTIISNLEKLLFKSYYHCKRGHGIQKIPSKITTNEDFNYCRFIRNLCDSKKQANSST